MRTAFLSATKHEDTGALRATAALAGRPVLAWQMDFARQLGCKRIICLGEKPAPEVLTLQHEIEREGGEFHLIRNNIQLAALLKTDDQLVMVLDGLLTNEIDPSAIEQKGERLRPVIWTIAAGSEPATRNPHDFERIDASRHWAGLAVINSATVQKLADCAPDGDPMSLLLRLGLQDGVASKAISTEGKNAFKPKLATNRETLISLENLMIGQRIGQSVWSGPFLALGDLLAAAVLRGKAAATVGLLGAGMAVALLIAAGLVWFDQLAYALILTGLGAVCGQCAVALHITQSAPRSGESISRYCTVLQVFIDVSALFFLVMALDPTVAPIDRLALPFLALGLARIAARTTHKIASAFWSDRALHLFGFAAAAVFGVLAPALALFGLGAVAYKLLRTHENPANPDLTITL